MTRHVQVLFVKVWQPAASYRVADLNTIKCWPNYGIGKSCQTMLSFYATVHQIINSCVRSPKTIFVASYQTKACWPKAKINKSKPVKSHPRKTKSSQTKVSQIAANWTKPRKSEENQTHRVSVDILHQLFDESLKRGQQRPLVMQLRGLQHGQQVGPPVDHVLTHTQQQAVQVLT